MTTAEEGSLRNREAEASQRARLEANLQKIEALTQRLTAALAQRKLPNPALEAPGQELFVKAGAAYLAEMAQHPGRILEHQLGYWAKALKHYVEAQHVLARGKLAAPADPGPRDRRFSNPLWDSHPWFNFLKQQYLISAEAMRTAVDDLENLDERDRRRVEYFTRQIVDMMSPTNFLATNPDALERAVATDGQSLVDGLENLVRDLEAGRGDLLVTLSDPAAFRLGENIAATEGAVVWRNELIELIQYAPTTEKVHRIPLVIFPPWINKFYILDLKPSNSLVKWIVDQGFTLFMVSWKNPDASYAATGMEDYVQQGYMAAIEQVKAITRQKTVNAVGYCIAGTTLALTLGLMARRGDRSVNSASFFTTLTDFSDPGEFIPFLDDDFLDAIEAQVARDGVLSKYFMTRTFSFLRSNDLIYAPAIRSYMMGEPPPAFDLLFWNGDGTNLPAKMAVEYLRLLCQQDLLATTGFPLSGELVRLSDVKVPLCAVACETDHIAAWEASFNGIKKMGSRDRTFILTQSGHIAGIVNPPGRGKYGHYISDAPVEGAPAEWKAAARFVKDSWWPQWGAWLAGRSGAMVPARQPGGPDHPVLAPAPGTYVSEVVEV